MKIVRSLFSRLAVILSYIESSSQSERIPDGGHYIASSQPSAEITASARSRSPSLRQTFTSVLGYKFEDFALIRLSPYTNLNRTFELRRYVFPPDKPIRLRKSNLGQRAMPTGEQFVLSTSDGDVCAILDKTLSRHTILRPLCTLAPGQQNRVKINMITGKVEKMTDEEIAECPILTNEPVAKNYAVSRLSSPHSASHPLLPSASSSTPTEPPLRERSRSPTLRQTFPNVLGYEFEDLASIRLVPHKYPHRTFKLRIYTLPLDKPLALRTTNRILRPVPTGKQIVLSSQGDVCAILLKLSNNNTELRPIWTSILGIVERVKTNMRSGAVKGMTKKEIAECPAFSGESITKSYRVFHV